MEVHDDEAPLVGVLRIEVPSTVNVRIAPAFEFEEETEKTLNLWRDELLDDRKRLLIQLRIGQTLRVGRSKNNDLVLEDGNVSRLHAVISTSESGAVLNDLSSLNGTQVNGKRITIPYNLVGGDEVRIGDSVCTVDLRYPGTMHSALETSSPQTRMIGLRAVEVTVLLADVKSYTKMSQSLPAGDVTTALQLWFAETTRIVREHGGEVDKYIGDCVMALWSSQKRKPVEVALDATRAAKQILAATEQFNLSGKWQHYDAFPWKARVALNTGTALSGNIGEGESREFTVLGDSINVAFRLEQVCGELGLDTIVGDHTAELIQDEFPLRCVGELELEGRDGKVRGFTFA